MPDRYWCTGCDVGYTDVIPGKCPHCGSSLADMEGFEDEDQDGGPEEYDDSELVDTEEGAALDSKK